MKIVPVVEAKTHLSKYLDLCEREAIVITKNGHAKALLIPAPEDEEELERLVLAYSPRLWKLLEKAAQRVQEDGGLSHNDFWSEVARGPQSPSRHLTRAGRHTRTPKLKGAG